MEVCQRASQERCLLWTMPQWLQKDFQSSQLLQDKSCLKKDKIDMLFINTFSWHLPRVQCIFLTVSKSSGKTLSVAFTDSISQSLAKPETMWVDRRQSGALFLSSMTESLLLVCWIWQKWPVVICDCFASVFSEGMSSSSISLLFITTCSSSRISRLLQLGNSDNTVLHIFTSLCS